MRILLVLITGAALCGCTGGALSLKSWEGQPVNDLIYAWGPPTRDASLPDGRRVVAYTPQHPYGSGAECYSATHCFGRIPQELSKRRRPREI